MKISRKYHQKLTTTSARKISNINWHKKCLAFIVKLTDNNLIFYSRRLIMKDKTIKKIASPTNSEKYKSKDAAHFNRLEQLIRKSDFSLEDILTHYTAFIRRRDTTRFLAHYELFKKIMNLPGSIVELGIYRGSGLFMWHHFMETFCPGDRNRRIYGFDHFEGYVQAKKDEKAITPWIENVLGDMVSSEAFINELAEIHNNDTFLPGVDRTHIIAGDVTQTLPSFIENSPGLRISLLYFDIGLYKPTLEGLKQLFPLVVKGGIIAFNGYGMKPWKGETDAVDEFFRSINLEPVIEKFPFSTLPHGYLVK